MPVNDYATAFAGAALCLLSAGLAEAQPNLSAQVNNPLLGQGIGAGGLTPTSDISSTTVTVPGATTPLTQAQGEIDTHGLNIRAFYLSADGSDWQPAYSRAIAKFNSNYAAGIYTPIYFPPGVWTFNSPVTTPFAPSTPAAIEGAGQFTSWIVLGAAFTGTLYGCSQTPLQFGTPTILPTAITTGCRVQDLSITGNTTSTGQDALVYSDGVDGALVQNVSVYDTPGYCLSAGQTLNKTNAYFRESRILNLSCFNNGVASTKPAVYVSSTGTQDASNQDVFQNLRVYGSLWHGVDLDNSNTTLPLRKITFLNSKVELSGGNNWQFGSTTKTGIIQQLDCISCSGVSPSSGNFNFLVTASGTTTAPNNLAFTDAISEAGTGSGAGFNEQFGKNVTASFVYNATTGTQVTVGCGVTGPISISGQGDESTWTSSICGSLTQGLLRFGSLASLTSKAALTPTVAFNVPGTSTISTTGTAHSTSLGGTIAFINESLSITLTAIGTATGNLQIGLPAGPLNSELVSCPVSQAVSSVGTLPAAATQVAVQIAPGAGVAVPMSIKGAGISTWSATSMAVGTYTLNFSCVYF